MRSTPLYRLAATLQLAAAIIWTTIQTLMLSLPALTAANTEEAGLRTIVICTGSELKAITIGEDGRPVTPVKTVKCPWGTLLGGAGQLMRGMPAITTPDGALIGRVIWWVSSQLLGSTSAQLFESRAPPLHQKM